MDCKDDYLLFVCFSPHHHNILALLQHLHHYRLLRFCLQQPQVLRKFLASGLTPLAVAPLLPCAAFPYFVAAVSIHSSASNTDERLRLSNVRYNRSCCVLLLDFRPLVFTLVTQHIHTLQI